MPLGFTYAPPVFSLGGPHAPSEAEKVHAENLQLLDRLACNGFKLSRRRGFRIPLLMKKVVDATPEQTLRGIEKGRTNFRIEVPGGAIPINIQSLDELAVLSAVYGAGATVQASHPALAHALSTMRTGVRFTAIDTQAKRRDDDYYYDRHQEIGPLGAWQVLHGSTRFQDFQMQAGGKSEFTPHSAEELVAYNYFTLQGSAADLEHRALGSMLQQLATAGVTFDAARRHGSKSAYEAYMAFHAEGAQELWLCHKGQSLLQVDRARLESDPNLPRMFQERARKFERLAATPAHESARDALMELDRDVPGHDDAEREAAMMALMALPPDGRSQPLTEAYRKVLETAGSGPLRGATDEIARLGGIYKKPTLGSAMASWTYWRGLESAAPPTMAVADKRERYEGLLAGLQSHDLAQRCFHALYADGHADTYEQRESDLGRLIALLNGRQERHSAIDVFESMQRVTPDGVPFGSAIDLYGRLLDVARPHRGGGDALEALEYVRGTVTPGAPPDLSAAERVEHFMRWLDAAGGSLSVAQSAWKSLSSGANQVDLEQRERILDRIRQSRHGELSGAVQDFEQLQQATRGSGGLTGPAADRFLRLMDAVGSFSEASEARQRLEKVAIPTDAAARDAIYLAVASAVPRSGERSRSSVDRCMDDYWYVVRNLERVEADPTAVATEYARYLGAASGNSAEARQAHSLARLHLTDGGRLGQDIETRRAGLAQALQAAGTADGAWRLLSFCESAPGAAVAQERLDTLQQLLPLASAAGASEPFEAALVLLERLVKLPAGSAAATVPQAAAALAQAFPKDRSIRKDLLDTFVATLVAPAADLTALCADAAAYAKFVARVSGGWETLTVWPPLHQGPAAAPVQEREDAMAWLLSDSFGARGQAVATYEAAAAEVAAPGDLARHIADVKEIRRGHGAEEAIKVYNDVAAWVRATRFTPGQGDGAERQSRFARMAGTGVSSQELGNACHHVRVPVGREDFGEREQALADLLEMESQRRGRKPLEQAITDYDAVAAHIYPGDALGASAKRFVELASGLRDVPLARSLVNDLQKARLAGEFKDCTLDDLIGRFVEAYAVGGNVDKAWEIMRQRHQDLTVERSGDRTVNIGGVKVPRREGEE